MGSSDPVPEPFKKSTIRSQAVTEGKAIEVLAKTDILTAAVQIVSPSGGETNLHSHAGTDQIWLVIEGEATFYGEGDRVVALLAKHDTLLVPRGTPYWFSCTSKEPLVIVRLGAKAQGVEDKRTDHTPRKRQAQVV